MMTLFLKCHVIFFCPQRAQKLSTWTYISSYLLNNTMVEHSILAQHLNSQPEIIAQPP